MLTQSAALSPAPGPRSPSSVPAPSGQIGQPGLAAGGPGGHPPELAPPGPGRALLATWHNLLDVGRLQDGEPNLAGTARAAVARMSATTAAEAGTADGGKVTVATGHGAITVPVEITDMPDRVVWLPANSAGSEVRSALRVGHGALVSISGGEPDRSAE